MRPVAVLDACVLFSAPVRDLLIRLAQDHVFRAHWSEPILDECFAAIAAARPDLAKPALDRTRRLMVQAVRGCLVDEFDQLVSTIVLPDPDDRHVVAAALKCRATVIVTFNVRDFPRSAVKPLGIEAMDPDAFATQLLTGNATAFLRAVDRQIGDLRNPPVTFDQLLVTLARCGMPTLALGLVRAREDEGAQKAGGG